MMVGTIRRELFKIVYIQINVITDFYMNVKNRG